MAEKRTINIDIKNNADETAKDFDTLNKSIDNTTKSTKNLNSTFEEVYGELQPLTTRMGEAEDRLYELALAGDTASKEYQELLTKVGEYRKVQIKTDLAVDGAAQTMTQKLGSALNGATSGFAATQGAMALFGDENQALEQSLLKVQSALAIQQGVKGLSDAYKELSIGTKIAGAAQVAFTFITGAATTGMKLFRLALISTGIGAIVIAVGLLIANFENITKVIKKSIDFAMKPLKIAIDAVVNAYYAITDALGITSKAERKREEQAKINAANTQTRIAAERKAQKEAYDERLKEIRRIEKAEQVAFDRSISLLESQGKSTLRLRKQRLKQSLDEAKELLEREKILGGWNLKLRQSQVTDAQIAFNKILKEEKGYYKQRRQNAQKFKDEDQRLLDEEIDDEIKLLAELDKIRIENETRFRTEQENELLAVEEKYDKLESMAYGNAEALNEIEIARLNAENEIKLQYANEAYEAQKAIDDKAAADKIETEKTVAEAKKNIQDAQIANVEAGISLLKDVAGENNKLQAFAIAAENAVGIAKIIISTQAANAAAKLKYAAIPGGLALAAAEITANKVSAGIGIAASVAAAAKGIASLKASASLDSGGSLGGGGAGTEAAAPQFNVVGDSGINQIAQLQQQPVQAFVVSGEVTTSQALDRNRVQNATL